MKRHRAVRALASAAALFVTTAHAHAQTRPEACRSTTVDGHSGAHICASLQLDSDAPAPPAAAERPEDGPLVSLDAPLDHRTAPDRDAKGNAASAATASIPITPVSTIAVEADAPVFENGEIPSAAPALDRMRRHVAQCAAGAARGPDGAEARGLSPTVTARRSDGPSRSASSRTSEHRERSRARPEPMSRLTPARPDASPPRQPSPSAVRIPAALQVSFLVRAPGRAEGVSVTPQGRVSEELRRCVMSGLSGRIVGSPSTDAVGVFVTFRLHPSKKQ